MRVKSQIMDEAAMNRALMRISHEILEKNKGTDNIELIGIKRRGVSIAQLISENIFKIEGIRVPTTSVDISFYRDDLTQISEMPTLNDPNLGIQVDGKSIILVDDVLYTGRTVRAAIEAIFSQGRPSCIQLAVLIDRGHRQLPLRPDYVGKNIPTSHAEMVEVRIPEYDGEMGVYLMDMTSD